MATDQGKLSNVNAIGIIAEAARGFARGGGHHDVPAVLYPGFLRRADRRLGRPPLPARTQVSVARLGRQARRGLRRDRALVPVVLVSRAAGEKTWRESVEREVLDVRENAGLCDVSMLGKIEIGGSDAAEFLNRVYCNAFLKLPVGKARYGLMLREDGMIYDDGTTSRLAENHYFMTTTTAYAAAAMTHLEFCAQALWPELDVQAGLDHRSVGADGRCRTEGHATSSRRSSTRTCPTPPSPSWRRARWRLLGGQLKGLLFRISFSGELAYELAVPAGYGESVADALIAAGAPHGIRPMASRR